MAVLAVVLRHGILYRQLLYEKHPTLLRPALAFIYVNPAPAYVLLDECRRPRTESRQMDENRYYESCVAKSMDNTSASTEESDAIVGSGSTPNSFELHQTPQEELNVQSRLAENSGLSNIPLSTRPATDSRTEDAKAQEHAPGASTADGLSGHKEPSTQSPRPRPVNQESYAHILPYLSRSRLSMVSAASHALPLAVWVRLLRQIIIILLILLGSPPLRRGNRRNCRNRGNRENVFALAVISSGPASISYV